LAREEVTFTNTSTGTFTYFEWDFGDGSPVERYPFLTGSVSPVTHLYGISGTYYPKLRVYNSVGCYKEKVEVLVVGKGYNVLIPNVFTPNGDTYNDKFKPLFSGFSSMQFTIYDYRGNQLFTEESTVDPANPLLPITLTGWDGEIKTESPYYIYSVYGITLFGDIEVQKSGTFIIIR
jgi:PKD repeat protein